MKDVSPHMYACEKHFRSWDFTSDKKGRKKLKRGEYLIAKILVNYLRGNNSFLLLTKLK